MKSAAFVLALLIMAGCSRPILIDPPGPPDPEPQVNGRILTPKMSDAEILNAFGIDISKAESKRIQGPDGFQMNYTLGDQKVTILRSMVTGIVIYATGPIDGHWDLDEKKPDLKL